MSELYELKLESLNRNQNNSIYNIISRIITENHLKKLEKMLHGGGKEASLYKVHGLADQNLAGYDITKTGNGIHGIAGHGKDLHK